MRIVIDLQGAQSPDSKHRGIGRYSLSIAHAIVRNKGSHEVIIALNGAYSETCSEIIESFQGLLPRNCIQIFFVPHKDTLHYSSNSWRRNASEILREAFLEPDVVLITSLFEGCSDNVVTSIGRFSRVPTAVVVYDLIPLIYKDTYLQNPFVEAWYRDKLSYLKKAGKFLTISDSTKQELIDILDIAPQDIMAIGTDAESIFCTGEVSFGRSIELGNKYDIRKDFIMYTGGLDERKNIEALLRAYSKLDLSIRQFFQLVIVCKLSSQMLLRLKTLAQALQLSESEVVLTGYVDDAALVDLYRSCALYVFPSWHEGFGLPILEAIRCGAAVIGSNVSSIPEVIGCQDALFNPRDTTSMADLMTRALTDKEFKLSLSKRSCNHCTKFSWDSSGLLAIDALVQMQKAKNHDNPDILKRVIQGIAELPCQPCKESDLLCIASAIDRSFAEDNHIKM